MPVHRVRPLCVQAGAKVPTLSVGTGAMPPYPGYTGGLKVMAKGLHFLYPAGTTGVAKIREAVAAAILGRNAGLTARDVKQVAVTQNDGGFAEATVLFDASSVTSSDLATIAATNVEYKLADADGVETNFVASTARVTQTGAFTVTIAYGTAPAPALCLCLCLSCFGRLVTFGQDQATCVSMRDQLARWCHRGCFRAPPS